LVYNPTAGNSRFFVTVLGFSILWYIWIPVFQAIPLFIITTLTLLLLSSVWISKMIIDWNYHLYIVTDHKILEMKYAPLANHVINEVLLDQVRCAEVNVNTDGFICELIDMGSVSIKF